MQFDREKILKNAKAKFPQAELSVEALDLYAQDLFKQIILSKDHPKFEEINEAKIKLYHELNSFRKDELDRLLNKFTSIKKEVHNDHEAA